MTDGSGPAPAPARQPPVVTDLAALVAGAAALGFGFLPFMLVVTVLAVLLPPRVGWGRPRGLRVVAAYVPFAAVWLLFVIGYLQLMHAFGSPVAPQPAIEELAARGLAGWNDASLVLFIVLAAPFVEEVFYRGYLFSLLDAALPRPLVHLLTAAVFGAAHGLPYALPIGVLSLLFGWLRARHAALLPCILAHGIHNGLTVGLVLLWPAHLDLLFPR